MLRFVLLLVTILSGLVDLAAQEIPVEKMTDGKACRDKGIKLIKSDRYEDARAYLLQGSELSEGELKDDCLFYVGISYYFEGAHQYIGSKFQKSYVSYGHALDYFLKAHAYKYAITACFKMGDISYKRLELAEQGYEEYYRAYQMARDNQMEKEQFKALLALIEVSGKLRLWEERETYSLALDSLAAASSDPEIKRDMLLHLGDDALEKENYSLAETYYLQVLESGVEVDEYQVYSRLRLLTIADERYEEALVYGERCIELFAKKFPTKPKFRYLTYEIQSDIYRALGDKENCYRCQDSLFMSQRYGIDDMMKFGQYRHRARMRTAFGEYEAAIDDYNTAESVLMNCAPEVIAANLGTVLLLRAASYFAAGDYPSAKQDYLRNLQLVETNSGKNSLEYLEALGFLARIEGYNQDHADGSRHYREAVQGMLDIARADLKYLPSSYREAYWSKLSSLVWTMSDYGLTGGFMQDDFTESAYNALLFSKGLLLASERGMETMVRTCDNPDIAEDYNRLLQLRQDYKAAEAKQDKERATALYAEFTAVDNKITGLLNELGGMAFVDSVSYRDVRSALGKGEVVVDFVDFVTAEQKHQYAAYIVKHNWEHPKLVSVFEAAQMDSLLASVQGNPDRLYEKSVAPGLYSLVWKAVEPYVGNRTTYIIPSGVLHTIALESVPMGRTTLGEKYRIVRLTSAKEAISYKKNRSLGGVSDAVLYGGLEYNMTVSDMVAQHERYSLPPLFAVRGLNKTRGDSLFTNLPSTMDEVIEIEKILTLSNMKVSPFTAMQGTEESFVSMSGQAPDILHIATHGFFYTSSDARKVAALSGYSDIMYLTGLVMAGGNAGWKGEKLPAGVLGGLLTSEDIAHLDLSATRMVVLSACETGLGEATNEGLLGLQRAFKKAGVQTLVMSLWQVSDLVTKEFMVSFYRNLTQKGWNKQRAFMQARKDIQKKYAEPYYWAGFVMVD